MKRIKGIFRVLGLATLMLAGATSLTLHRVEAHLKESLRGFAEQVTALDGFRSNTVPRQLFVNGLALHLVTVSTPLSVKDALDRFQSTCHAVGQIDLPAALKQKLEHRSKDGEALPAGVIRQDAKNEGFLACIDLGVHMDAAAFLGKLGEFGKTKNLRSLGQMRYALARRHAETTSLLMLWTEGDAQLAEMFPKHGDAPGGELHDVPRPKDGRRLVSAFEQGMPFGFAAYSVEGQGVESVSKSYAARLAAGGWQIRPNKARGLLAEKGGRKLLVQVNTRQAGQVVVTISDLG